MKGAWTGWLNTERESEEWKLGRQGRKKKRGVGGWRGVIGSGEGAWSLHKPIVMPPLSAELLGLVYDGEEEQFGLINHNGN